jgi:DNA-binding transcriptional ArsR family regulator
VTEERGDPVDSVLVALADPTRRRLLDLLADQGEGTATTLAERLPVSRQAVVKHLAVLDAAGLVAGSRVGGWMGDRARGRRYPRGKRGVNAHPARRPRRCA